MSNEPRPQVALVPPVRPGAKAHPRRAPAHRSVSLFRSPKPRLEAVERSDSSSEAAADRPAASRQLLEASPSSLQPLGRDSSGESSNAEKWFEESNNEVRETSAPFADNEPPFFMRNSSSSNTPPEAADDIANERIKQFLALKDGSQSLPLPTGLLHEGTDGSSTEDFRSVIDDLTIENKKLKRRLKKYEKLHDSHLKDEKLFEVRIHGLPPEKKRELEDMLRKFASGLSVPQGTGFPPNGYEGLLPMLPMLRTHQTGSSQMSMQQADSAYASMSASGQGGSSSQTSREGKYKPFNPSAASRRQNIHSYLHHIPEGLLPQFNPATMTDRAKKKVVVKRLEHLFAGKGAAAAGHQQAIQQQDVSQMAARADRSALEAQGQRVRQEGTREALIMRSDAEEANDENIEGLKGNVPSATRIGKQDLATRFPQVALEQRPTRPLDLDPHRAQIPSDNIRYMRHLGFSPPDPTSAEEPEDGHGWVYLNLLVNMAQLHTINVTADFVRKSLEEYSEKFEISRDGRKVRWNGGTGVTRTSSESGDPSPERTSGEAVDTQSPRKRMRMTHGEGMRSGIRPQGPARAGTTSRSQAENKKLVYTPLFFHRDSTEDSEESSSEEEGDDFSSPFPAQAAGDSTGMTSSGVRTTSTKQKKNKDDGPIIFYNNARFCTDLSGECRPAGNPDAPPYVKLASQPIGVPHSSSAALSEKRGPLASAAELPEPMDLGDNPIPESLELTFPPDTPYRSSPNSSDREPIDLEVTGIGGIYPADNFAIRVQSRHARVPEGAAADVATSHGPKLVPPRLAQILHGHEPKGKARAPVRKQILSARKKDLPPSELPPALSYVPVMGDESDSEDENEEDDDMSFSPETLGGLPPSQARQAMDMPTVGTDDEAENDEDAKDDDDDDSDAESDGSLDLLAVAREVDPEAIRAREREYDANMAERLAEDIPTGSSAATAGGGSGYASPVSGVDAREHHRVTWERRRVVRRDAPRQARASDSMRARHEKESTEEEESAVDSDEEMSDAKS